MKTRKVTIYSGKTFTVPQGIQRIDTTSTHGWQVRYAGTKLFSDHSNDGSGAKAIALTKISLGTASKTAWEDLGYDLDGKNSTADSTDLCKPASGAVPKNVCRLFLSLPWQQRLPSSQH